MNRAYDPIPSRGRVRLSDDDDETTAATVATQTEASGNETSLKTLETHYLPLYCVTGFFAAVFIFVPFLCRGPDRWTYKACVMLAAFCMWLLWVTIYIAQMNPIIGPRVTNETLAWIAYRWGDPMSLPEEEENTPNSNTTTDSNSNQL